MRLKALFAIAALTSLCACGPTDIPGPSPENEKLNPDYDLIFSGDWAATLEVPGGTSLPLVIHMIETSPTTYTVMLDSPDQGAFGIEGENGRVEDRTFLAEFPIINASISLKRRGNQLKGTFIQGLPMPITFTPAGDIKPPARPQEDALVRDYVIKPVSFAGGADGAALAGELTMPRGEGPFPAAVLISGSGPQDRNEELLTHKPFLILSDHLTRNGYAVLRYDDRGTAESTGSFEGATTKDFADDAAAALKFLRMQASVDVSRAGYIGHSEGGLIAPLAAKSEKPDYMVLLAGPTETLAKVVARQTGDIMTASGAPDAAVESEVSGVKEIFDILRTADSRDAAEADVREILADAGTPDGMIDATVTRMVDPWMMWVMDYDITADIAAYDGPVLALFAEKDLQVSATANAPGMEAALTHEASVVKTLPGLNHLFQPAETGSPAEYAKIEITFDEGALMEISNWLNNSN